MEKITKKKKYIVINIQQNDFPVAFGGLELFAFAFFLNEKRCYQLEFN